VAAPGFYYEGSGAFDPFSNQWIHHAGHDGIPQGFHTFTCDLASGAWTQRFPPTSPPGVCCVDGANVFDLARRCFVRFPGGSLGHGYQWSRGVRLKESAVCCATGARHVDKHATRYWLWLWMRSVRKDSPRRPRGPITAMRDSAGASGINSG
jgi:hypothetical protein